MEKNPEIFRDGAKELSLPPKLLVQIVKKKINKAKKKRWAVEQERPAFCILLEELLGESHSP